MFDRSKQYPLQEAVELVKKTSYSKFDGSVEIHINLNPLALGDKTDFRGTVSLPHGTGKQVKVIEATEAVIAAIEAGKIEFDILVARPSMMSKLARVAKILGPRGLMPNPKTGTVTDEIDKRIKELSSGKVNYKTEPNNPIIHLHIGKVSFEEDKLSANIAAVIESVGRGKITKATLAATMGPGIRLQV
ncbi:hypothetical protein A2Z33_00655 [Candidatus Gottesmanbacteria bacterium RBG_16_52_11]|uniref:Ribosomal protein n=1 Tax=Candidatus Gottesmanbacteria bacterium RBG_16_52_11 TaxID=1798374 RepID=A0A1F5YNU7_9BACT|nr:MAG: hypothetical protein A2Z33_00655 [Candidatus Gottesmanbacteria bacterium RBG_16_52_11]